MQDLYHQPNISSSQNPLNPGAGPGVCGGPGQGSGARRTLLQHEVARLPVVLVTGKAMWEFPKIRGTLFWGPYNKDPTI